MRIGVDTSEFAGVPAYEELARVDFAIVRTSSGVDHVDKLAAQHLAGFRGAGVAELYGYHYQRSWRDGAAQADHALATIRAFDVPAVFLNLEPAMTGPRPEDAPHIARDVAHAFLRRWITLTGRRCPVYGPISYLRALRLDGELVGPLWAALTRTDGQPHPGPVPPVAPWEGAVIHQHQHNVPVVAREGRAVVDWNRSLFTRDELRTFLGLEPPASYEILGPVVAGVRAAEGRTSAETFVARDEGPSIERTAP